MGGGGGGSGTQKVVDQQWPDQIFPTVNFIFSHDGHCGLEGGGGALPPPPPSKSKHRPWGEGVR